MERKALIGCWLILGAMIGSAWASPNSIRIGAFGGQDRPQYLNGKPDFRFYETARPDLNRWPSDSAGMLTAPATSRFPRSTTRYINFAALCFINWQAIPDGKAITISYTWLLEDGSGTVYADLSGRKNIHRTATVMLTEARGSPEPGLWKVGIHKLELFVDERKFGEASFEIFEDELIDPILGKWVKDRPREVDWVLASEPEGGVIHYLDQNNVKIAECDFTAEDDPTDIWTEKVLSFWTCEVRDNPGENEASKTVRLWRATLEEPIEIWPEVRFFYNFQNEYLGREEEHVKPRMIGSSGLWRRLYDRALRNKK